LRACRMSLHARRRPRADSRRARVALQSIRPRPIAVAARALCGARTGSQIARRRTVEGNTADAAVGLQKTPACVASVC
jgi:hypothetical protein